MTIEKNTPVSLTQDGIIEKDLLHKRKIASFYLILLSIQLLPLEGYEASLIKAFMMILIPPIWILVRPKHNGAYMCSALYFMLILFSVWFRDERINLSVLYTLACLCTFSLFCAILYDGAFTYNNVLKLIRMMIFAYTTVLIIQQIYQVLGIGYAPYINRMGSLGFKFNSLCIEPSHFGRLMAVYLLAFLEMRRLQQGGKIHFHDIWLHDRTVVLASAYSLITSGSGTGIVALFIIGGYILFRGSIGFICIVGILLVITMPYISHLEQVQRATSILQVAPTLDIATIRKTDNSAATRIAPLLSALKNFRPEAKDFWFGQNPSSMDYYPNIGIVEIYGALAYLGLLFLLCSYCFRGPFSVEVVFFIGLFGATVGNVAYVWASMMLFAIVKYFSVKNPKVMN